MRSRPSRSAVPGATAASASSRATLRRTGMGGSYWRPDAAQAHCDHVSRRSGASPTADVHADRAEALVEHRVDAAGRWRRRKARCAWRRRASSARSTSTPGGPSGAEAGTSGPAEAEPRPASASRRVVWVDLAQLAAEADLAADDEVGRERPAASTSRRRRGRCRGRRPARRPGPRRRRRRRRRGRGAAIVSALLEHGEHDGEPAGVDALRPTAGAGRGCSRRRAPGSRRAAAGCPPSPARPRSRAIPAARSARKKAPASGTSTRPASVISNRPSSPDAPKRCLTVRTSRSAWWRSPSKATTVSTTCSSTRGPARAPSLVTWPTSTVGHAAVLRLAHEPVGAAPHLGHRARRRAELGILDGLDRVDDEEVGLHLVDGGEQRRQVRLGEEPHAVDDRAEPLGPRPGPGGATPRPTRRARAHRPRATAARTWVSSVDLPMPGSPPSSVTDPGTRPPPSTRSSSATPVGRAPAASGSTAAIGVGRSVRRRTARRRPRSTSSARRPPRRAHRAAPHPRRAPSPRTRCTGGPSVASPSPPIMQKGCVQVRRRLRDSRAVVTAARGGRSATRWRRPRSARR